MKTRIDQPHQADIEPAFPERRPGGRPGVQPDFEAVATSAGIASRTQAAPAAADAAGKTEGGRSFAPAETAGSVRRLRHDASARSRQGGRCDLLRAHAPELVAHLQAWAQQLDAREAELKAREALLELRERASRLVEQQRRRELDDLECALAEQQRLLSRRLTAAAMALGGFPT